MPFILIALIGGLALLEPIMSINFKSTLYSISLTIKSFLMFTLPFVIMTLLFQAALRMTKNATKLIILILGSVCISNFLSTWLSYGIGNFVYHLNLSLATPQGGNELIPSWALSFPALIANDKAMFLGLFLGILGSFFQKERAQKLSHYTSKIVHKILLKFQYCLPLFVCGFVVKMLHDGVMLSILKDYSLIFLCIAFGQFAWITFLYAYSSHFRFPFMLQNIRNMLPAAMTGFSTMSSAAAMPLTIIGTEKNTQHSDLAKSIIPATVNIHLIGDCFAIPIFAFAILKSYELSCPSFLDYVCFSAYFVLAKFSVAAIPGGGVIVMLPILEKYLGFSSPMLSLITALYILFDPIITSANVFGNGAFALLLTKRIKKT